MVFIDYKSLGVRQLGSIYEGLLEHRLWIADEDKTTVKEKSGEKVIPLSAAKGTSGPTSPCERASRIWRWTSRNARPRANDDGFWIERERERWMDGWMERD